MINAPSKSKKKQFALQLQKDRLKIKNKHIKPIELIFNYLLKEILSKKKFKNIDMQKTILSYEKEFQVIIKNIYKQCFRTFGKYLHNSIKNDDKDKKYSMLYLEKKQTFDEFEMDMLDEYDNYANEHTNYILQTIINQFIYYDKEATQEYYIELNNKLKQLQMLTSNVDEIGITGITALAIANNKVQKLQKETQDYQNNKMNEIIKIFKNKIQENVIKQSSERIANQETLFGESFTRQKEAEYMTKTQDRQVFKEWNSMFLETSRTSHMDASGQKKKIDEYFEVRSPSTGNVEYGLQPKDDNFSLDNKINCYCFIIYYVE